MSIITDNMIWVLVLLVLFVAGAIWMCLLWRVSSVHEPVSEAPQEVSDEDVSRSVANEELMRLREMGGNGSHRKVA